MIDVNRNLAGSIVDTMAWKEKQSGAAIRNFKPKPLPKSNKQALHQLHADLEEASKRINDSEHFFSHWFGEAVKSLLGFSDGSSIDDNGFNATRIALTAGAVH